MKFRAFIDECNNDYRSWCGREEIIVDSWEEAELYCKEESWTGSSYIIDYLFHKETNTTIRSKGQYDSFVEE